MQEQVVSLVRQTRSQAGSAPIIGPRVELQLLTTLQCNLKCSYCSISEGDVLGSQGRVQYDIEALDRFVRKHLADKDVYVTFYGGEPTLNRAFMEQVMSRYPGFRFQLQTNGTLIDDLPDWVLAGLANMLVSIDGGEAVTDGYRGRGIYRQVLANVEKIRDRVTGPLTARMTWSSAAIDLPQIESLLERFDYLYFQFVADHAYGAEAVAHRKTVLDSLVARFFRDTDRLLRVIPLMGIVRNKLFPEVLQTRHYGRAQCRVSSHILNVMPDGRIFPCPDLMHLPEMQMGDIAGNWLVPSPLQATPEMPCRGCEADSWCHGNCMKNLWMGYVRCDEHWRTGITDPVCELVRYLGQAVDRHDYAGWFAALPEALQREITDCPIYDYVEIMP